jgi:hypothetical protein
MMDGIPALKIFIPLEGREVDHPCKLKDAFWDEIELLSSRQPQPSHGVVHTSLPTRSNQQDSIGVGVETIASSQPLDDR